MQITLLCYTRRVPIANSQRGAWMKLLKNLALREKVWRGISRPAMVMAVILAALVGMAVTASAQAPAAKRTIIHAGHVLNVRTGELRANQAIVVEGDKIARPAKSRRLPGTRRLISRTLRCCPV
jgi:hypothetical protein